MISHLTFYMAMHDYCLYLSTIAIMGFVGKVLLKNINNKNKTFFKTKHNLFKKSIHFDLHKDIKRFIEEHNDFCRLFHLYNKFWSRVYLTFFLTLIPLNLIWLHTFFFEQIDQKFRIFIGFTSFVLTLMIFILQYSFAYISNQIHKNTKILSKLQWRLNGWPFRLQNKLKLMTYFERLSNTRKIGLSLGPTVVLTFPVFAQVLIEFN